jgi:chromosome segregation ATPase
MPPKDQVFKIITDLQALAQALGDVADLKEAAARAKADLDSINQTRAQAEAQLRNTKAGLSNAQIENQRRFEQEVFVKQGELKGLAERIDGLRMQARELADEVASKGAQLSAINNSLADARRKLAS